MDLSIVQDVQQGHCVEVCVSRGIDLNESDVLFQEHKCIFLERRMVLLQAYLFSLCACTVIIWPYNQYCTSKQASCTHKCHKIMTGLYKYFGGSNFVFNICHSMSVQSAGTCVYTLQCNNPESQIISFTAVKFSTLI